ncbi:peptide-N(4)-(N-acetyl-beta-glucosaminyl)asparagine amidase-like [Paramacrobiotus metropolitanus]|uniref:peptide-N(4)-(N-acetyl-beta- glucosaminyl)asparagine amidase-like n=1 Tax=Paramacrobiotus metropolitanus TaxID=2943436 RepID=UPI0024461F7C|nr:peptide-N(4)-(N-acetyl-beta-glucosaminyl)asparagine amidase-like [Paramacrobiotus metropolitanus]XP_055327507.1 peptide-N(4)-(N-acetyl-beta-glucosaminyl)asparagine amidase-like [Paramacrobiotus metropolitanus]
MSWQNPYNATPAGALPPGYPTSSTTGMPPAGSYNQPYPAGAVPGAPGYPTSATLPPGYPTSSSALPAGYNMSGSGPYPAGALNMPPYNPAFTHPDSQAHSYPYPGAYPSMQSQTPYGPQDVVGYVFRLSDHEKSKHHFDVKYSPSIDKYVRMSDHNQEIAGWRSLVYAEQNIQQKVEHDHQMSYLARKENGVFGRIEWRFDSTEAGKRIKRLHVKFPWKLYEDGQVHAYIATERGENIPLKDSDRSQEISGVVGLQRFSIIAELSRGQGEHAWQHAQLFRQNLKPGFFSTDDAHYPFRFSVELD